MIPEDFEFRHGISDRALRGVVHSVDAKPSETSNMSDAGVPLDLVNYATTTGENGETVTERLITVNTDLYSALLIVNTADMSNFCQDN